jgi:hypothetical protein
MDVVRHGLGLAPRFAYLAGENGSVRALVPLFCGGWARQRRWLNVPQSCASDPLSPNEDEATLLLEKVAAAAAVKGVTAIVLRTPLRLCPRLPEGWVIRREEPMVRHVLDLSGAMDYGSLPRIQRKLRQKIRSAGRRLAARGTRVRLADAHEVPAFARAVHRILLCAHGHLGLPARFFEALHEFLPESTRLAMVGGETGPVLSFQVSVSDSRCCNLLYGCGLPTPEGSEGYRLGLAAEIDEAIKAGLRHVDFGETGADQEGLLYFKETWGADRVDGSYLILAERGAESGLRNINSGDFLKIQRLFHYVPVSLSLMIAGLIHEALQ